MVIIEFLPFPDGDGGHIRKEPGLDRILLLTPADPVGGRSQLQGNLSGRSAP